MIQALHVEKPCRTFVTYLVMNSYKVPRKQFHFCNNRNKFWHQGHTLFIINMVSSIPQGACHWHVIIMQSRCIVADAR
jgi:hypothetical protein